MDCISRGSVGYDTGGLPLQTRIEWPPVQRPVFVACLWLLLTLVADVQACAVPVFRFALERWPADLYEVDVFHRGELTAAERALVSALEDRALINGGDLNWEIVPCDVGTELAPDLQAVWDGLSEPALPFVVLRMPGGRQGSPQVWSGPLAAVAPLSESLRSEQELVHRVLSGNAVVWVVLRGTDSARGDRVVQLLTEQLPVLQEEIELPQGVGLPGSELLARIPLAVQFSVLDVATDQAANSLLRRTAAARTTEPVDDVTTLVLPVFGRGRAVQTLVDTELDADFIAEISRFLCGACSCQVKQLNPGFDLLLPVSWDERLYGDEVPAEVLAEAPSAPPMEPSYAAIPPGRAAGTSSMSARPETAEDRAANEAADHGLADPSAVDSVKDSPTFRRDWYSLPACVLIVAALYVWRRRASRRRAELSDRR
jgi:hypothetical protein